MSQGLLPQDVVVLAKLVACGGRRPPIAQLASELSMSSSQVHVSLKRLDRSRLIEGKECRPLLRPVEEFLVHGVKYAFPARRGETTRGTPTAHAAPPLNQQIVGSSDPPPVWPFAEGQVRGSTFEPLHKTVPAAAAKDPALYERARNVLMRKNDSRPDKDNPEWSEKEIRTARPLMEMLPPETAAAVRRYRGQRGPQQNPTKELISLRVDRDVVAAYRATGSGWQTRANEALKAYATKSGLVARGCSFKTSGSDKSWSEERLALKRSACVHASRAREVVRPPGALEVAGIGRA